MLLGHSSRTGSQSPLAGTIAEIPRIPTTPGSFWAGVAVAWQMCSSSFHPSSDSSAWPRSCDGGWPGGCNLQGGLAATQPHAALHKEHSCSPCLACGQCWCEDGQIHPLFAVMARTPAQPCRRAWPGPAVTSVVWLKHSPHRGCSVLGLCALWGQTRFGEGKHPEGYVVPLAEPWGLLGLTSSGCQGQGMSWHDPGRVLAGCSIC